jgi:hypothetical protein
MRQTIYQECMIFSTELQREDLTGRDVSDIETVLRLSMPPDATSHFLDCMRRTILNYLETITGANLPRRDPRTLRKEIRRAARKLREIATAMQELETRAMAKDEQVEASESFGRYDAEDRQHFEAIRKLIEENYCRSVTAAAQRLAHADRLKGPGTPDSKAKRLARRFLKENKSAAGDRAQYDIELVAFPPH